MKDRMGITQEEAHEMIAKMMEDYNQNDDNVDIPIREEKINLGYGDAWYEPDPKRDKNDIVLDNGVVFADWNKFTMDELANYLEQKYMFLSSGEALAVMKMVDFYRKNKK
jgi:hypothetical protein